MLFTNGICTMTYPSENQTLYAIIRIFNTRDTVLVHFFYIIPGFITEAILHNFKKKK